MELVSNFFKKNVSNYFRDLPLPNSFENIFKLSGEQALRLVPFLTILAWITYILFREMTNFGNKKKDWVNKDYQKSKSKIADLVSKDEILKNVQKESKVAYCRCWKSKSFPFCDGTHTQHNIRTGDNVGPLVITDK